MPRNCCRTGNCPSLLSQSFMGTSARKQPSLRAKFSRCCVHVPTQRESLSKNTYLPCSPQHHIVLGMNAFLATIGYVCVCLSLRRFVFKRKKERDLFMLQCGMEHVTWCLPHCTPDAGRMKVQQNSSDPFSGVRLQVLSSQSICLTSRFQGISWACLVTFLTLLQTSIR